MHGDRRFADDPGDRVRHGDVSRPPGARGGAPEGPHHQGEDPAQLRLRAARGVPQGAARHAPGREVPPAGHRVHRHAGGLPRDRVRGARRRRGDRAQPPGDGRADVPVIVAICGEGGSGGALGIAIGDRVLIQQFAIYSVIPPEGCSAILWRDANRKVDAAQALKLTAPDLLAAGIVDAIVPEPLGGAHQDPADAAALLGAAIEASLVEVSALAPAARLDSRLRQVPQHGPPGDRLRRRGADRGRPVDACHAVAAALMVAYVWDHLACDDQRAGALAAELGLDPVIGRLLVLRGHHRAGRGAAGS